MQTTRLTLLRSQWDILVSSFLIAETFGNLALNVIRLFWRLRT